MDHGHKTWQIGEPQSPQSKPALGKNNELIEELERRSFEVTLHNEEDLLHREGQFKKMRP